MSEQKLRLRCPLVVEGKYDKIRVSNIVETPIFVSDGFHFLHDKEKIALLSRVAKEKGLIILSDSDKAGNFIRGRLKSVLGDGKLYQVYAPQIAGKEKRKETPSADGLLGVEGIDGKTLRELLLPFAEDQNPPCGAGLTHAEWYADGFSGRPDSGAKRKALAKKLDLPDNLTSDGLLEALNLLYDRETYERIKNTL